MIDFIKVEELANKDRIRELLDFGMELTREEVVNCVGPEGQKHIKESFESGIVVNKTTGELSQRKRHARLKGLIFTLIPGGRGMRMQGSLHKFSNGGEKNNDRFTFDDFLAVAEELEDYISPRDRINVIEIGLNVRTPYPPGHFLKSLICHKGNRFNLIDLWDEKRAEAWHKQYRIKIYDKSLHQGGEKTLPL